MFFETVKRLFTGDVSTPHNPLTASGKHCCHKPVCDCQQAAESRPAPDPDPNDGPCDDSIFCTFCDAWVPDVPTAIDAGWIPSFYDGEHECSDIVCSACIARLMRQTEIGEFELINPTEREPERDPEHEPAAGC